MYDEGKSSVSMYVRRLQTLLIMEIVIVRRELTLLYRGSARLGGKGLRRRGDVVINSLEAEWYFSIHTMYKKPSPIRSFPFNNSKTQFVRTIDTPAYWMGANDRPESAGEYLSRRYSEGNEWTAKIEWNEWTTYFFDSSNILDSK